MKIIVGYLLLTTALCFVACGGGAVEEARAFVAVRDEVTTAWAKEMDANPTESGVENMRKVFESKKADLAAKKEAFMQVSDKANSAAWRQMSDTNSSERMLTQAMIVKLASSPAPVQEKLRTLIKEYTSTVEIPNLI